MGETREEEAHVVVDIPGGGGEEESTSSSAIAALKHHPLAEISQSPGHLLLLKLWQREEDLLGRRIAAGESLLDSTKREVFRLCCLFFAFHGIFLTLLYAGGSDSGAAACGSRLRWWLPCCLSLVTSLALVGAVQSRLWRFWAAARRVQRERAEARAVARCVQELRMKGKSFDLCKVPAVGGPRRMKSAGLEMKWRVLRWCRRNVIIISLLCVTAAAVPAVKLIICG